MFFRIWISDHQILLWILSFDYIFRKNYVIRKFNMINKATEISMSDEFK